MGPQVAIASTLATEPSPQLLTPSFLLLPILHVSGALPESHLRRQDHIPAISSSFLLRLERLPMPWKCLPDGLSFRSSVYVFGTFVSFS